jgi:hypothetical protein
MSDLLSSTRTAITHFAGEFACLLARHLSNRLDSNRPILLASSTNEAGRREQQETTGD